jgi:hypothetical protein
LQDGLSRRPEKEDKSHRKLRPQQQDREQPARKDDAPLHVLRPQRLTVEAMESRILACTAAKKCLIPTAGTITSPVRSTTPSATGNVAGQNDTDTNANDSLIPVLPLSMSANPGDIPTTPLASVGLPPWAKTNFVDHTLTDQTSSLRFIEGNGISRASTPLRVYPNACHRSWIGPERLILVRRSAI